MSIRVQPAVTETQRECFQLWIVIVSVIGGLVLAFILIALLGLVRAYGNETYYIQIIMCILLYSVDVLVEGITRRRKKINERH